VSRIIHDIDFTGFQKQPKWLIGFSDITVLHAALQKIGVASIHGPMAAAFNKGAEGEAYIQTLKTLLEGGKTIYTTAPHTYNSLGTATAPLVGGNLCMMAHLIGSKNNFETAGKLLFIEDIGEYHYNLDRLMIQMKQAGMFEKLAGLMVGGFTEMKDLSTDFGANANEIIHSHVKEYEFPICYDFPISHAINNYPVMEGGDYTLSVTAHEVLLSLQ
jgi:muramoyltetrapeptide carboxypeptidase